MGCVYKGWGFCRNNGWIFGKLGQGIHCTKMGANSSAENTPNAPEVMDFNEKKASFVSP